MICIYCDHGWVKIQDQKELCLECNGSGIIHCCDGIKATDGGFDEPRKEKHGMPKA